MKMCMTTDIVYSIICSRKSLEITHVRLKWDETIKKIYYGVSVRYFVRFIKKASMYNIIIAEKGDVLIF